MSPLKITRHPLWLVLLMIAATLASLIIPLHLVTTDNDAHWLTQKSQLDIIISIFFLIDFILNLPSYLKEPTHQYKQAHRTLFILDILATVPWRLFFGWEMLDLMRLFKLFRIPALFQERPKLHLYINVIIQLIGFTYWVFLWLHWIACGWIGISQINNIEALYLNALYWSVTTLSTVGYGDITPKSTAQTIYAMFIMLLGVGFYGYIIGNLSNILRRLDMKRSFYREKINQLHSFLTYRQVPKDLQYKIFDYYDYLWSNRMGFDESQLISELPIALQEELSLSLKKELISKVPFFKNIDESLLRVLAYKLKPVIYTPKDVIFRYGEIGKTMYFIGKGSITICDEAHNILATLQDGNFLGELALIHERPRNAHAIAVGYCDLYSLSKEDFDKILQAHPEFSKHLMMQYTSIDT